MSIDSFFYVPAGTRNAEPTERGYKKYKSLADFKVAYDNRHFPHQVKWVAGGMIDEQYFFEQAEDAIWFFVSGWRSRDFFANGEDGDMVGYGPTAIWIDDQQRCEHCADPLVPGKTEHVHCDTCGRPMEVCADCFDNSDDCPECECDCVLDPEDGSTIQSCESHPNGGSPRSKKWATDRKSELERLERMANAASAIKHSTAEDIENL
jgi:hypothetical protein